MSKSTTTPAPEFAPNPVIVGKLAGTYVTGSKVLAARVRYVAQLEADAAKAGARINWSALVATLKDAEPEAVGISTASLSKARTAGKLLTDSDKGLGRKLASYADETVSTALRLVQDLSADKRDGLVRQARQAVAELPESAPADVIREAIDGAFSGAREESLVARRAAEAEAPARREAAREAREAAAREAEQRGRDAVAGIVEEVTPVMMTALPAAGFTHVLDLLGAAALMLADTNDVGTLEAAEGALSGLLADVKRYRAAVADADVVDALSAAV